MDLGNWQRGCNAWGVRGLFPTSCVQELNLSGRSKLLSERSAQAQAAELPAYALGQARALMSLHAQLNEELDFREGDLIIITGLPEPGWFQGELEGHRGIFPEGFVELLGPLRSPQEPGDCQYLNSDPQEMNCEDPSDAEEGTEREGVEEGEVFLSEVEEQREDAVEEEEGGIYGVALYEFRAMEPGELEFDVGDRIRVINTLEDGWLEGELRGQRGVFPHRFVKIEDNGQKNAEDTSFVEPEENKENMCTSEYSTEHLWPNGTENDAEWGTYEDHTVWDLDFFERSEEQRQSKCTGAQTNNRWQRDRWSRPDYHPHRPAPPVQGRAARPRSSPPARPSLPPRPSLPLRGHVQRGPLPNKNQSNCVNGNVRSFKPKLSHSLTLPSIRDRPPADGASTSHRDSSLTQALIDLVEGHKRKTLTRHASITDADVSPETRTRSPQNGSMPASVILDNSASDLEAKLSQQLFLFEKSLTASCSGSNVAPDLNHQFHISRHFSILDYRDESDIMRGSSCSPVSHLSRSDSASSSLDRCRTLRPPPPRPRARRPPAPAACRPARPAPRPPPRCSRQNAAPPASSPPTSSLIFYAPDEPAANLPGVTTEGQPEIADLAAAQEHEAQCQLEAEADLEREMELESQRQREEEERYQLLLRLQAVEHDMEEYAHTAEELRAMLEEEEEETARMQAMENLEFCNYTLETLALEQQQLQGRTVFISCLYIKS